MSVYLEDYVPVVKHNGLNSAQSVSLSGASTLSGTTTVSGAATLSGGATLSGTNSLTGATTLPADLSRTGEQSETVDNNKTLDEGDSGVIQVVTVDAKTVTLPATVLGTTYIIRNGGADGTVAVTVAPNASDKIMGNGFTSADNKAAINTKATAKKGDQIVLVADGANGWFVQSVIGTWARQA